jgi:CPA2 family monovalent cation:H+ antiporter-2
MAHDLPVLRELLVLAGVSLAVVLLFQRLRVPALIGFIVTGILVGPGALGLVSDRKLVQSMAEIGVVLLLFTVGLEFSLSDIRRLGRAALVGGALQSLLTVAAVAAVLLAAGAHPARALFFGMLVSLSSTAVVLKLLTDRVELAAPHGRAATGVCLFQDLLVIPFALLTPLLGRWLHGDFAVPAFTLASALSALVLVLATVLVLRGAQRAIPWLLGRASSGGSREAFLFAVLLVALGSAWLASLAGISLALGAFVAGLMLAESELRPRIASDVLPFRDALSSVFFIAIGMSLDPRAVRDAPLVAAASTVGLVVAKVVVAIAALRLSGLPWRVAVAAGLVLAQVGEFSFVLAQAGGAAGLLGEAGGQAFVIGAVFSLLVAPFLIERAPGWALAIDLRLARGRGGVVATATAPEHAPHSDLPSDHVVIGGYGLNGHNVARVLRATRVRHRVVDLDGRAVRDAAADGSPALAGDITLPEIQHQAGVTRARVLVLALSDPSATRQAVRIARSLSRTVFIVVRTRYVAEIDGLHAAGANQVIPEEFETSIEIFTAVLREFHLPTNLIQAQIALLRQERYSLLRGRKLPGDVVAQLDTLLAEGTTDTFMLMQHSPAVGRTLGDLGLAGEAGPRAVAVVRGGTALTALEPGLVLRVGDTLVLTGTHAEMDRAFQRLRAADEPAL